MPASSSSAMASESAAGEGARDAGAAAPESRASSPDAQPLYEDCFVCGRANPIGLHISFFSEGEMVRSEFVADLRHKGYPGLVHGGILYTVLDETIGRTAYLVDSRVMT